jgi:hypothetical protein
MISSQQAGEKRLAECSRIFQRNLKADLFWYLDFGFDLDFGF